MHSTQIKGKHCLLDHGQFQVVFSFMENNMGLAWTLA